MRRNLKNWLSFLPLLVILLGFSQESYASHAMGADLTYECINNCTIRVHLRGYRDCSGITYGSPTVTFTAQGPGCPLPVGIGSWSSAAVTEVTPICPGWPTRCSTPGAAIIGVEEYYWWRDYNICNSSGCTFTLSWTECCRNSAVSNLNNAGSQNLYIGATTLNGTLGSCNSSPQFNNPPTPYVCAGQSYTFNQGATDPDGDSLSYAVGPCFQGAGTQVTYAGGYSGVQPMGASWNVSVNPATGDVTMTPQPGNILSAVICIYVFEWRNGVMINTVVRDVQITVINCPSNAAPSSTGVTGLTGGFLNGPFEMTVCAGSNISFNIPSNDPNGGQQVTMSWDQNLAGLGGQFYQAGNPGNQNSFTGVNPTGHFTWTPLAQGNYYFLVTLRDNSCPIYGQNQYTITIHVNGGLVNSTATGTPIGCVDAQFLATPGLGGNGPYTYIWSGDGNLNLNPGVNTNNFNHTYPGPGTYGYTCVITDAYGCQGVVMDSVTILSGPTADAGPDISLCSGYNVSLGAPVIPGQTYLWTPGTNLNNTAAAQPTFNYTNPGAVPQTFNYTLTATAGACTAVDFVTVVVNPTPVASISGNLSICSGTSTTLTANGGTSFLWSNGATTQSITVSPTQTTTYTVVVDANGCSSAPAQATVVVSQGPTAIITGTDSVCPGGSATLMVVGGTNWQWSTGATSQTITLNNLTTSQTVTVVPSTAGCLGAPVSFTVNIYPKPVADYTSSTECIGNTTTFTDGSTVGSGSVISWNWNFGDPTSGSNNFSNNASPAHQFTSPGVYNVTLMVQSSNGCRDTVIHQVTVNPLPVPDFSFNNACLGQDVIFQNLTPGNITSFDWTFGDGGTSNVSNPTHTYAAPGPYNVTLTVTNGNGCVNSVTKTVFVWPLAEPNFTYVHSCFNTITQFTSTSTLNDPYGTTMDAYSWNFGDLNSGVNNTSSDQNPIHSFTEPNTYQVTLTVTTSRGCQSSVTLPVVVDAIAPVVPIHDTICAGFQAQPAVWPPSIPAGFVAEWFYTPTGTDPFLAGYNAYGFTTQPLLTTTIFYVGLLEPETGCRSGRVPVVCYVNQLPGVDISVNAHELDIPNAVAEFTTEPTTIAPIISYSWSFGDGGVSGESDPIHQYTEEGIYDVFLTIIDSWGCTSTYNLYDYITVNMQVILLVPNAFTPNGDGLNDEFFVSTRLVTDFQIDIYDRWGKLIYSTMDLNFKWNGTDVSGADLPEGAYIYNINGTAFDGSPVRKSGTITLLR